MKHSGVKRLFRFRSRTREEIRNEIGEEFRFHVDMRTDELVGRGLTEEAARVQALCEFGDQRAGASGCAVHGDRLERRRRVAQFVDELRQDAAFGVRLLARSPGFSAASILTLAVAIGANTAIFTVVNALLLKPVPVAAPEELARVQAGESTMSWRNYEDLRDRNTVFSDILAHRSLVTGLATRDTPARMMGHLTSPNYFSVLGVGAALGRTYAAADSRRDAVVVADHVWRARFGSEPSIVGRLLTLGGRSYEVVGVMPPAFRGLAPPGLLLDFWLPVDTAVPNAALQDRRVVQFEVVGRLKSGVGHQQAAAAMRLLAHGLKAEYPDVPDSFLEMEVSSIQGIGAFEGMASLLLPVFAFLALMTVVAGFVLLIGCANIAGLLIGRTAARRREIAMRLALGAGRGRLLRQLLTESLLLALIGGAAGVLVAIWLTGSVNAVGSQLPIPIRFDLDIDRRVLGYAIGLTTCTCLLFGLAPARRAAGFDLVSSLKDEGGTSVRQRLRHALVVGQVAVCSMLLVWSGLFLRSLSHVNTVDPGFDATNVLLATVELDRAVVEDARGEQIFVELQKRVQASPGVQAAGMSVVVPLALTGREEFSVSIEGDAANTRRRVFGNRLSPGWFDVLRIPLVAGRDFTWEDRKGTPRVAIVNETLARQFWNGDALGKYFRYGKESLQVVGVARDSKYRTLGERIAPTVYQPIRQAYMFLMTLHVRTTDMRGTSEVIHREMRGLAPEVAVVIEPMTKAVAVAVLPARIGAAANGAFGVAAMLLAMLGVYGLVSFSVVQRTREMGVRKALGARTSDIARLVIGASAASTAAGLVIGLACGALGAMVLRGFLTGVSPLDAATLIAVAAVVMGAAVAASALPALRAARVDPLVTLRDA